MLPAHDALQQQQQQQDEEPEIRLTLVDDNLLVACDARGEQIACYTLSGAELAADAEFLQLVKQELQREVAKKERDHLVEPSATAAGGGQAEQLEVPAQGFPGLLPSPGATRAVQPSAEGSGEVESLMALLLGSGSNDGNAGDSGSCEGSSREDVTVTAGGTATPADPIQPSLALLPGLDPHWVASAGDNELAEALQAEEDAEAASAALPLPDWQLAREWQEQEDAALAAALAAEEAEKEAAAKLGQEGDNPAVAANRAAAGSSSGSYWSKPAPAGAGVTASYAAALGIIGGSEAGDAVRGSAGLADNFPSLQVAAAAASTTADCKSGRDSEGTRQLLRRQHQAARQQAVEHGGGVRLLLRNSASQSPPLSPRTRSWLNGGSGLHSSGLPPLQLDGGLQLHEDDLHYQLLLKDESVKAAAKAAALGYAQREAAARAEAAAASTEALRSMMDAAAGNQSSRPGSANTHVTAGPHSTCRPGSASLRQAGQQEHGGGGIGDAAACQTNTAATVEVAPPDTKSLRRLVEDMKSRGWQVMPGSAGGHIRCERTFPDLPGFKQVYFLSSTPSDRNYVWHVAAAVKRFDREYEERRAAAVTAAS